MTAGGPAKPDLSYERAEVLALIAATPMTRLQLQTKQPLGNLPPELEAKLWNRADAPPPPPAVLAARRTVVPAAVVAGLDAVGVVVAVVTGHVLLAVLAGVLFLAIGTIVLAALRYARDPNALSVGDRRAIAAASSWESRQDWSGPIAYSRERGLVVAATQAARRIAASPAWRSGRLDEQRIRIDLRVELDQVDEQAHRIAQARQRTGSVTSDPAVDAAWDIAVDRVAALFAYAGELDGTAQRRRDDAAALGDPVRDEGLMTGSAQDQMALENLVSLRVWMGSQPDLSP